MHKPPALALAIGPEMWDPTSPLGRVLIEAGTYLASKSIPAELYVEEVISGINPDDNRPPGWTPVTHGISRMDLKVFLQFLRSFSSVSPYAKRVTDYAERARMQLMLDEDGASLFMDGRRRQRI